MPKVLSDAQIDRAKREGYVCPVPVMDADRARGYLDRFEAYERATGQSAPRDLKVKPHLLFTWMMEMGTTPRLLDAIEDLIGPNIMLVTSAVWAKNARDPAHATWHQDSAYFGYDPMEVWSAWIGITDSYSENGCLRYLPGTHLHPEMEHIETYHPDNLLQRGQVIPDLDDTGAVDAEVAAGEATLHHFRLAHSSLPNPSDQRRIGFLFVFCPPHVRPTLGRYPALCVRGENTFDHWDTDPVPERDMDPAIIAYSNELLGRYADPKVRSEAERKAGHG